MKKIFLYRLVIAFALLSSSATNAQEISVTDTVVAAPGGEIEEYSADEAINDSLTSRLRFIPADTIRSVTNDKVFYYKNYFDSLLKARQKIIKENPPVNPQPQKVPFFQSLFEFLIWIFAIALVLFIIYRLFLSNSSVFRRNRKNKVAESAGAEEEHTDNMDAVIGKYAASGNYRMAIRYLYLQTLQTLAERKYIETGTGKTNYQYAEEVRRYPFANEFASLILKYEYTWYGEYPVDNTLFGQIQTSFKNFNAAVSR